MATMPSMPEAGQNTDAAVPAIRITPGIGNGPGGVEASRIERTLRAAANATQPVMRGQTEQTLFTTYARSVVLIVTRESLGSGSVIDANGTILTNAHVVAGYKSVGIIFKPLTPGVVPRESDAVRASVVRVDQVADLALIKVVKVPSDVRPLRLGDLALVRTGAHVHAIGHPFGEAWSYTKGTVAQVRLAYEWKGENGNPHRADVVQMQTPVNPGNAGGPFLNDAGEIVGVDAFGRLQGSDFNVAVAPTEVNRVLRLTSDRLVPKAAASDGRKSSFCEPARTSVKRTKKGDATLIAFDADCNGKPDTSLIIPDDRRSATLMLVDKNENGKIDVTYVDKDNDMKFDYALYDTNEDGKTDLIGYDLDDALEPGRIVLARA